jgi:lipoprotein-releasing system permease protein
MKEAREVATQIGAVPSRPSRSFDSLPFELFIAFRYLMARRKQAFIALISFISVIGLMVGVMAVLIALALMTGLQGELRERIVGASAHVYVFKVSDDGLRDIPAEVAKMKQIPHVVGAAPAAVGKGMLTAGPDRTAAVTLKGIDPALEVSVTDIRKSMRSGSLEAIRSGPDEMDGIVLGTDLATTLEVQPGDTVRLLTPDQVLTPMGMSNSRIRAFKVAGIFSLGLFEFDSEYALVDLPVAERMLGRDQPQFLQLRLDDMFASKEVAEDIPKRLGKDYATQDWAQMNKSLFSALWLEKMAIAITIGLIMTVAAVNIVASLVLLVMEKTRDIAILKTMGTSTASIRRIFMLQGLIIGVAGTAAGTVGGIAIIYVLDRFKLIRVPIDVYQISYIPFTLQPLDLASVVVAAIAVSFLATIYPARQAAKLDPAQALRFQ